MDEYRDAWCVELYDPFVLIQLDAADASGTTDWGELPGYTLDGEQLAELTKFIPGLQEVAEAYLDKSGKPLLRPLGSSEYHLFKRTMRFYNADRAGARITGRIEAKIDANSGQLHLRIHLTGAVESETIIDEMTYRGRYLVHWAPPEPPKTP